MAFTEVRLIISDILYPTFLANQLTILSATIYQSGNLAFFKAFSLPVWFFIMLCFVVTLICNVHKTYKIFPQKFTVIYDSINVVTSFALDQFLVLMNKGIDKKIFTTYYKLIKFSWLASTTRNFKKGLYRKVVFVIWAANCFFWVQLFVTEILSNLTNNSMIAIDSINQLLDLVKQRNNMHIKCSLSSYLYNYYMKVRIWDRE